MEIVVFEMDKKLPSGHTYPRSEIENNILCSESCKESLDNHRLFIDFHENGDETETKVNNIIAAVTDIYIEDNKLKVKAELLDTPMGNMAKENIDILQVFPVGAGMLNEDGVVSDYEFYKFSASIKGDE